MVVWMRLFFVSCNPRCLVLYLNKIWFLGIVVLRNFYLAFFLCMPVRGIAGQKTTFEKPLMAVKVFSKFLTWTSL